LAAFWPQKAAEEAKNERIMRIQAFFWQFTAWMRALDT